MTCTGDICAHIEAMPDDGILTSRDLLQYGFRSNVDKTICRLIKNKILRRIARGVFIKFAAPEPSPLQVAIVKAKSFGKQLVTHGQQIACEFQLIAADEKMPLVYQVMGRTSSFLFLGRRILMKGVAAKKMFGGETALGKAIRALNFLGRDRDHNQLTRVISLIDPDQLLKAARWMPSWLADDLREALVFRQKTKTKLRVIAS